MVTRKQLDQEQDKRIRYILNLAYENNPHLHKLMNKANINPQKIRAGDGVKRLKEAYAKGLRTTGEDLIERRLFPKYIRSIYSTQLWTSGTSGRPKITLYSLDDIARSSEQVSKFYNIVGIEEGIDGIVCIPAPFPFATAIMLSESCKLLNVPTATIMSPQIMPHMTDDEIRFRLRPVYETIRNIGKKQIILAGTWGLEKLGHIFQRYGFDMAALNVKGLCYGAEPTTFTRRQKISKTWQPNLPNISYEVYASSEGGAMAVECTEHDNMHVSQPEIVLFTEKDGQPLEANEYGYDVITALPAIGAKPATFIINYSHKDITKVVAGECNCSMPQYIIEHPRREIEQIRIAGCGLDARDLEPLFNTKPFTGEYLVIWEKPHDKNSNHKLTIRYECSAQVADFDGSLKRQLAASNPLAYDMLFTSGAVQVNCEWALPGKNYSGFEQYVNPGKSTRLITII